MKPAREIIVDDSKSERQPDLGRERPRGLIRIEQFVIATRGGAHHRLQDVFKSNLDPRRAHDNSRTWIRCCPTER